MPYPPLASLRIPSGWKVTKNVLSELDPMITGDTLDMPDLFHSGMVLLQRDVAADRDDAWAVDLGWVPSYSATGAFRLALLRANAGDELHAWSTRSRSAAIAMLEKWLAILTDEMRPSRALFLVRGADISDQPPDLP